MYVYILYSRLIIDGNADPDKLLRVYKTRASAEARCNHRTEQSGPTTGEKCYSIYFAKETYVEER